MSHDRLHEAQAQLVQAQADFSKISGHRDAISSELQEIRQLAMMRLSVSLQDVNTEELLQVAKDRATIRDTVSALNVALSEAEQRFKRAQDRVNGLHAEITRIKREANIPEIYRRSSTALPQLQALELELAAICDLWPSIDTSNMPEVIPFMYGLLGHLRRLRPEIERVVSNAAEKTRKW